MAAQSRAPQPSAHGRAAGGAATGESEWTWRQRRHQAWLAAPEREPAARREWAQRLGVTEATLAAWEDAPGWWDEVRRLVRRRLMERLPAVLEALASAAIAGDVEAARVVVELARGL